MSAKTGATTAFESSAKTQELAREWELLLAACSADSDSLLGARIPPLLSQGIDWDKFLSLAEHHGTSSLVYRSLSRQAVAIPANVLSSLRQRFELNVHKSLFLTRELIRILNCIDALNIDAIPYKGIVMSELYYGDIALRQAGDMDFFVRRRDVHRIKSAVAELGYTPRVVIPESSEEEYMDSGYECTFDTPAGKNLLELQWALQPRYYAVDFDMHGLFDRAVNAKLAERTVRTPSDEDLLLVLAIHAAKHVWERLIWLCDIAQILKRRGLDWDSIRRQARELGVERILRITLLLDERLLGAKIPAVISNEILRDRATAVFADEIAAEMAAGIPRETENISYFRMMMRLRERRADRWRFVWRLAFTPGPAEWQAVRLPRVLFPLYRLVRLGRLAARFSRR